MRDNLTAFKTISKNEKTAFLISESTVNNKEIKKERSELLSLQRAPFLLQC